MKDPPGRRIFDRTLGKKLPASRSIKISNKTNVHSNSKDTKEVGSPPFIEKTTPVPNYVKFEVINGFAVAYGDILLGVPEQDVKEGVCHPPIPVLWKSKNIPYLIHPDLKNKEAVESAIDYFNRNTSIRFIPYSEFSSPPEDTILFEPMPLLEEHCLSYLGHIGGIQPIQLGKVLSMSNLELIGVLT
jgi:hypothetical protein